MHRRFWLSLAMLALGTSLLVAAGFASPAESSPAAGQAAQGAERRGGTLRVNVAGGDVSAIDPAVAYGTTDWAIEYSTALKLLNYPDRPAPAGARLRPEAASRYTVSNNGRTYTFFIRPGQRFSNGERVTPNSFVRAFMRVAQRSIQSPGYPLVSDPAATNIVGIQAVYEGRANRISGLQVRGNRLIIRTTRSSPDTLFKLSMPFFQATSARLPLTQQVINVTGNELPSAGPYYVSFREPNRTINVRRNRFYRGPRPRNVDAMNFRMMVNLESGYRQVLAGEVDYQEGLPPTAAAELARRFGTRTGRFRVEGSSCIAYLALNNEHPLFRNNAQLRRAVNYAINRQAMINIGGAFVGRPEDQILTPPVPGYRNWRIYPNQSNFTQAQRLARGRVRDVPAKFFYGLTGVGPQRMELVRSYMQRIGIRNLDPEGYRGLAIYDAAGRRGSSHALSFAGWCMDYPDPYDYINVLLYGKTIHASENVNIAYFNNPTFNRRMEQAAKLKGDRRFRTYAILDRDIMRQQAPWAPYNNIIDRYFFGTRVNTRSILIHPVYENPVYNALTLR